MIGADIQSSKIIYIVCMFSEPCGRVPWRWGIFTQWDEISQRWL